MIEMISSGNIQQTSLNMMGGKARALTIMKQKYFPIPEGFVVLPNQDLSVMGHDELQRLVQSIGGFPVVVRSSALNEDGAEQSFAGIYESYLNVNSYEELKEKITLVRESADQERVKAYQKDQSTSRMAVLVQKQVDAVYSGVLFSIHPMTGNENEILIDSTKGLADELVSGKALPKTYVLNSDAEVITVSGAHNWSMPTEALRQLVALSQMLSTFWGRPQDIEWCLDRQGQIWIVQSRPITKIFYRQDLGEWSNADFRDGGVSATACLPLMASLYDRVFQSSLAKYFRDVKLLAKNQPEPDLCGYFYGRLYWNTSVVKKLLVKIPGFHEQEFDEDLGIYRQYGQKGPVQTPLTVKTVLPFLPALLALESNFKKSLRMAKSYRGKFQPQEEYFQKKLSQMAKMSDLEFYEFYQEVMAFHLKVESDYFTVIYNSTNFQSLLKDGLKSWNKKHKTQVQFLDLISDLGDISHLRVNPPLMALAEIERTQGDHSDAYQEKLQEVVREFYYFSDRCLDLTVPRWGEDASLIQRHLRSMTAAPLKATKVYTEIIEKMRSEIAGWIDQMGFNSLLKKIKMSREFLIQREEMRDYSTRLYYFVRLATLEMGRRLEGMGKIRKQQDVFYIPVETLTAFAQGLKLETSLQEHAIIGHIRYQSFLKYPAPNEFGMSLREEVGGAGENTLKGLGCSAGVFEGTAFVAEDLSHAQNIEKGQILIAQFTEPGWTPLFPRLSAVVTEVGGMLSHAAVISREFGLPAVLNVAGATRKIKTGDRLRVDGRAGTVEILES